MEYIDYFEWILNSDKFLQKGEDALTMVEPADGYHKEQRVSIKCASKAISSMKLYCFNTPDTNASKLLPFFNQRGSVEPIAPQGLLRFCDYILLVQHDKGLFVFFLEMKRGVKGNAEKQIEASTTFFDYVRRSAERIKSENSFPDFDPNQIRYRRIVISDEYSNKKGTRDNNIEDFDMDAVIQHKCHDEFRPIKYCVCN